LITTPDPICAPKSFKIRDLKDDGTSARSELLKKRAFTKYQLARMLRCLRPTSLRRWNDARSSLAMGRVVSGIRLRKPLSPFEHLTIMLRKMSTMTTWLPEAAKLSP
jgi:hypothetical protein